MEPPVVLEAVCLSVRCTVSAVPIACCRFRSVITRSTSKHLPKCDLCSSTVASYYSLLLCRAHYVAFHCACSLLSSSPLSGSFTVNVELQIGYTGKSNLAFLSYYILIIIEVWRSNSFFNLCVLMVVTERWIYDRKSWNEAVPPSTIHLLVSAFVWLHNTTC